MGYYLSRKHNSTNAVEYKSATSSQTWTSAKSNAFEYSDSIDADEALKQAYSDLVQRENYTYALESTGAQ